MKTLSIYALYSLFALSLLGGCGQEKRIQPLGEQPLPPTGPSSTPAPAPQPPTPAPVPPAPVTPPPIAPLPVLPPPVTVELWEKFLTGLRNNQDGSPLYEEGTLKKTSQYYFESGLNLAQFQKLEPYLASLTATSERRGNDEFLFPGIEAMKQTETLLKSSVDSELLITLHTAFLQWRKEVSPETTVKFIELAIFDSALKTSLKENEIEVVRQLFFAIAGKTAEGKIDGAFAANTALVQLGQIYRSTVAPSFFLRFFDYLLSLKSESGALEYSAPNAAPVAIVITDSKIAPEIFLSAHDYFRSIIDRQSNSPLALLDVSLTLEVAGDSNFNLERFKNLYEKFSNLKSGGEYVYSSLQAFRRTLREMNSNANVKGLLVGS